MLEARRLAKDALIVIRSSVRLAFFRRAARLASIERLREG